MEYVSPKIVIDNWIMNAPEIVDVQRNKSLDLETMKKLGMSEESYLGRIIAGFNKITLCNGYINLLCGRGNNSIVDFNSLNEKGLPELFPGALIIAYDTEGNLFALNAGASDAAMGNVLYLANNSFAWEDLEMRYAPFLNWIFGVNLAYLEKNCWKSRGSSTRILDVKDIIKGKAAAYKMFLKKVNVNL